MSESAFRIKDIAKHAGVSIGTVDRVIHNRGKVSPEAKQKVIQILEKFNYQPNLLARSLSRSKKIQIAILTPDPTHDEYWQKAYDGIKREMAKWSHHGVLFSIYEFNLLKHEDFSRQLKKTISQKPDGIVLAPIHYIESHKLLAQVADTPFVLFNSNMADLKPLSFIGQDLYQSGRVAAHLIHSTASAGEIGIIHMDEDLADSPHLNEKEEGFRSYFSEIDSADSYSIKRIVIKSGGKVLKKSLQEALQDKLVGLFITTSNGTSVVGQVLEQLNQKKLTVVGYDLLLNNVRLLRKGIISYLINQNPHLTGSTALSYLLDHLLNKKTAPAEELFPIDIVSRENAESYLQFQKIQ